MHKICPRCLVGYEDRERSKCLYCGMVLRQTDTDWTDVCQDGVVVMGQDADSLAAQYLRRALKRFRGDVEQLKAYLLGAYLGSRDMAFMYHHFRCEWLHGPCFKRPLPLPLRWEYVLIWPWMLIAVWDALWLRLTHRLYCPACGWKYSVFEATDDSKHDPQACHTRRCHDEVLDDILSGRIVMLQKEHSQTAADVSAKRRVYERLTRPRSPWWSVVDGIMIAMAIAVVLGGISVLVRPHLASVIEYLQKEETISWPSP